ncbi:MAG: hypothetical protein A3E78_00625 [Alphaproteobacteria bacterium RIFCSPHIGHO2_12_FULL_63_12]|nr:MAG: hypothetical protein A3E78_00625 [Alphaproteobacteria bacterium RIFCSPHIGHO2_12_FULL_63_12]
MRVAILTLAAFAVTAACSKQPAEAPKTDAAPAVAAEIAANAPDAPSEEPWPANFPKLSADFAGVYNFSTGAAVIDVKAAGSGVKQRLTFPPGSAVGAGGAGAKWSQAAVNENDGEKMLIWPEGDGAPAIAMMMSRKDLGAMAGAFGVDPAAEAIAKRTGTDNVAGLSCAVWEFEAAAAPGSACVTRDGIVLRVISGGATALEAKSIERGPQDPALFAPPAGYEIVDMGECLRMGAEMMEAMRAGASPDMAKMEKCRALGDKVGAMMGQ